MEITDIIKKQNSIEKDKQDQFFIASEDFMFQDFPVLKNSLVKYNVDKLEVNLIGSARFDHLISSFLQKKEDGYYNVDKVSNCELEVNEFNDSTKGIWHNDHFDEWDLSFAAFIERIRTTPTLKYSGIEFSSLMYKFNIKDNKLLYFINVSPITIPLNNHTIKLPEELEIAEDELVYQILPISGEMKYLNVLLSKYNFLNKETGILTGNNANDFDAKIIGNSEMNELIVSTGTPIEIMPDGRIKIELLNKKTYKIEKYEVVKVESNETKVDYNKSKKGFFNKLFR